MRPSLFGLVRQSLSSFGSSSGQNFLSVGGHHSLSEAMDLASLSFLGLIGSNHDLHLLILAPEAYLSSTHTCKA